MWYKKEEKNVQPDMPVIKIEDVLNLGGIDESSKKNKQNAIERTDHSKCV
tara:strand:- start:357 stop:506 length:150 start_codon:yes stop_codon:yes gene_type:complete